MSKDRPATIDDFRQIGREHGADRARDNMRIILAREMPRNGVHLDYKVARWFAEKAGQFRAIGATENQIAAYLEATRVSYNALLKDATRFLATGGVNRKARRAQKSKAS